MWYCSCSPHILAPGLEHRIVEDLGQRHTGGTSSISDSERRQPHRPALIPPLPNALQAGLDRIKRGRCVLIASVYRMGLLEEHQELPVGIPRQKGRDKWEKA